MTEETIFALALEQSDATRRAAFLAESCGGDAALRERVEALLRTHKKMGDFLNKPVGEQLAGVPEPPHATEAFNSSTDPKRPATPQTEGEGSGNHEELDDLQFLQPATRSDSLGRIGHYEVLQVLGKGGFGLVFRAFDDVLHRIVAVKVLSPRMAATSPARKRFLREARSSAQVRHENVVQVYEVGEQPLPYIAMEFIPGETLQQRLDRVGPLETPEILRLGRQIAEGLAAAHATGLIHRDIKPGNVLIEEGPQGRVKITDFGLARTADDASMTQSGLLAGTPMYMAPEQAQGETLDQRADLFSLGSVLYVMATGRPPFRAATTFAVLKRVVDEDPRPIREVIPEVPQSLCDIITRLHAKKPEDRFQSAREVADVLTDCATQLEPNAKLQHFSFIPQSKPAAGKFGRWKWIAAAALLLPVLALALTESTGLTHWLRDQQPTPAPLKSGDGERVRRQQAEDRGPATDFTNTLAMKFKLIPAGKFRMGSSQKEIDGCLRTKEVDPNWLKWFNENVPTEGPEHEVEITQPFYMGTTEVTVEQFRQFVQADDYQVGDAQWANRGLDHNPVIWVSWHNAVDFCNWLSNKEGKKYRLPTEAEWEYCCRAGKSGTRYCCGDESAQLGDYAWYGRNSGNGTHRVAKKKPNDWGLYDMHGNAWEWCQDYFDPTYYHNSPLKDPTGGAEGERVVRGGAYDSLLPICRSAMRSHNAPDHRYGEIGFRVLLVLPPRDVRAKNGTKDKPV